MRDMAEACQKCDSGMRGLCEREEIVEGIGSFEKAIGNMEERRGQIGEFESLRMPSFAPEPSNLCSLLGVGFSTAFPWLRGLLTLKRLRVSRAMICVDGDYTDETWCK